MSYHDSFMLYPWSIISRRISSRLFCRHFWCFGLFFALFPGEWKQAFRGHPTLHMRLDAYRSVHPHTLPTITHQLFVLNASLSVPFTAQILHYSIFTSKQLSSSELLCARNAFICLKSFLVIY